MPNPSIWRLGSSQLKPDPSMSQCDGEPKRQSAGAAPSEMTKITASSALENYARLWALYVWVPALDALLMDGQGAVDQRPLGRGDIFLLPLALLAAIFPSPGLLALAQLVKLCLFCARLPFVWDHEWWTTVTEGCLVACVALKFDANEVFLVAARVQTILLYASAAFWKVNTSFLSKTTSCGSVILVQQLAQYAPKEVAEAVAPGLAIVAPWIALAVEALIPTLMITSPELGVSVALLFHGLVLLTPAPNYAGGFSVACAHRLLLCMAPGRAAKVSLLSPAPVLAAAVMMAIVPSATCAAYAAIAVAHIIALSTPNDAKEEDTPAAGEVGYPLLDYRSRRFVKASGSIVVVYGIALPILGLLHMGSCSMYANLKHWGGSNHLLVPTGLLFDWFKHAPPDTVFGNAFGGGLVRVDSVRGTFLEGLNAWARLEPEPVAANLLRTAGHGGVQGALYYAPGRMASLDAAGHDVAETILPVAMPAYELRRALHAARKRGHSSEEVMVVRLPSELRSPGGWLAYQGRVVRLRSDGNCVVAETGPIRPSGGGECNEAEMQLTRPPPWWLALLLLPYPSPLLPGDHNEIHCSA